MSNPSRANTQQVGGNHYKKFAIEIWDFIHANNIPYLEGNAIKYIARWREKGGIQDLEKAKHYIDKIIELEQAAKDGAAISHAIHRLGRTMMYGGVSDGEEHEIDSTVIGG